MSGLKLSILGFLILVTPILQAIAVFTPNWFNGMEVDRFGYRGKQYQMGIVPYSSKEGEWQGFSSVLLYGSMGLAMLDVLIFLRIYVQISHPSQFPSSNPNPPAYKEKESTSEYPYSCIQLLHAIAVSSAVTVAFNGIAFFLMAINIKQNGLDLSFGYSPWFSVAASILTCGIILLAEFIANRKAMKTSPTGPTAPSI
ncbi:hypothetical protein CAEBREN_07506 [Caenorhabditis brenneri]|uniref:Uncharacterized protein n=1 Tax=Caenorhabditis brenneri TaxID=135651 RepID=G0NNF3_CAEBE|nr:hypothetical protein CAEBREN_07506 [Caenorhabditis brenneri]